jgi:hypothetical protein
MKTLVMLCCAVFSVLMLAATAGPPRFVVPNFPDLAIKTRRTSGDSMFQRNALYLKGARQRTDILFENPRADAINWAVILQCDRKRTLNLNERDKLYVSLEIQDWSQRLKRARLVPQPQPSGAEVTMTIDSVDTGERRQFVHYTARRVQAKIRVEPGPGASTPASVEETDGWYIDIPGFSCQEQALSGFARLTAISGNRQDRWKTMWLGKAPRGYAIEETSLTTMEGKKSISKVELLDISEAPIDSSIFELPPGYKLALQTGDGGADLTKPDTLANRAQYYWARAGLWLRTLFR